MVGSVPGFTMRATFSLANPSSSCYQRCLSIVSSRLCSVPPTGSASRQSFLLRSGQAKIHGGYPALPFSVLSPSWHEPAVWRFDKVPEKLPDWWDDDDDDDEENDEDMEGGGGKGGNGGEGSARGGGKGDGGGGGGGGDNGDGPGNGFFAAVLAAYTHAIKTNPVRTKAISTCVLALLGDFLAQKIAQQDSPEFSLDSRRSVSIGIWGFCFMGPVLHYWYGLLDRVFLGRFAVVSKLLSDQLLFAPLFNGAFMVGTSALEGNPIKEVMETVKGKMWPSMKANWTLWPAAQFVNFTVIPRTFQIVYVNCVALVWNIILTYISHDDE